MLAGALLGEQALDQGQRLGEAVGKGAPAGELAPDIAIDPAEGTFEAANLALYAPALARLTVAVDR